MPIEPLKPGTRKCMKCGKPFKSVDLTTNRLCKKCNRVNRDVYIAEVARIGAKSRDRGHHE